jgi:hypothetical protein
VNLSAIRSFADCTPILQYSSAPSPLTAMHLAALPSARLILQLCNSSRCKPAVSRASERDAMLCVVARGYTACSHGSADMSWRLGWVCPHGNGKGAARHRLRIMSHHKLQHSLLRCKDTLLSATTTNSYLDPIRSDPAGAVRRGAVRRGTWQREEWLLALTRCRPVRAAASPPSVLSSVIGREYRQCSLAQGSVVRRVLKSTLSCVALRACPVRLTALRAHSLYVAR